ncbi:hypothetical protein [Candidatus Nitrospira bockiana]
MTSSEIHSFPWAKVLHYGVFVLLLIAGGVYLWIREPSVNPMADPLAAEAMALVQTHRAQQAPTIRQAITDRAKSLADRGQGVRLGEWRVEQEAPGIYLVGVSLREQAAVGWFERNYLWRVDVAKRDITPLTLAATSVMPLDEGPAQGMT